MNASDSGSEGLEPAEGSLWYVTAIEFPGLSRSRPIDDPSSIHNLARSNPGTYPLGVCSRYPKAGRSLNQSRAFFSAAIRV